MKKIYITLVCLGCILSLHSQNKYFVKVDGIAGLNGKTWNWASNDLQDIIDKSSAGDSIFVAVGTYYGGFFLKEGVVISGGYTANYNNIFERYNVMETSDLSKQSILDGQGTQRVVTQYNDFNASAVLNGFVIQNGKPSAQFQEGSIIYSKTNKTDIVGVLYKYDTETGNGMMIGMEEMSKQWGGYQTDIQSLPMIGSKENAIKDLSGQANSKMILDELGNACMDFSHEDYPLNGNYAAYWCDTLNIGGYDNWHLPSIGELNEVGSADIHRILNNIGKSLKRGYWSSSHAGNSLAWSYYFESKYFHPAIKYAHQNVRAVHPFYSSSDPGGIYSAGGGVFLKNNGIIENCIVKNNSSSSYGGGVYAGKGSLIKNCTVEGNNAPEGKEIYYEDPTDIPSVKVEENFLQVFPNPVKAGDEFRILLNNSNEKVEKFQLLNSAGKLITEGSFTDSEIAVKSPSQQGIYILKVKFGNKLINTKILVY